MNILILEDNVGKEAKVKALIAEVSSEIKIDSTDNFQSFTQTISSKSYDLIIVDLVVPTFCGEEAVDRTSNIIEVTRDFDCINFRSPVIALTGFNIKAEENFKDLNSKDIAVVTFDEETDLWKTSVRNKIEDCIPPIVYDFVIICALAKESDAFSEAGYNIGDTEIFKGLSCREIMIETHSGVIVTAPRMGLVSSAIVTTQAIELFKPKLVCMSGICGGVDGEANIYDVVIPVACHQHDAGKWTKDGCFEPELNSVQLDHSLELKIDSIINQSSFLGLIKKDISLLQSEFPKESESLDFSVVLAPASSGCSVIVDKEKVDLITGQKRKITAFEMESFAVYEASRLSVQRPSFFSAKSVVDNGIEKGDEFHRVACILSAKVVYECIKSGLIES